MPESRGEWVAFVVGLAVVGGLVFAAVRARHHAHPAAAALRQPAVHTVTTRAPTAPAQIASTATTTAPRSKPESKARSAARRVALTVTATGASTWVEVRAASANGPVLYAGTLSAGARKSFHTAGRFWARFGGAGNVAVALNGRPLHLPTGTYDALFDSQGFSVAATG